MQLLLIDTSQIQPYIFGSNRLRENIGASYLVAQATGEWALAKMPKPHNVADAQRLKLDDDKWIERDDLKAEVVYVGGGNVVALFADETAAKEFTRAYSRDLLQEAPNLQVVVLHQPFDWEKSLYQAVQDGFKALAEKKRQRAYSTPLLGLGVTEMCRSTAFPAVAQSRHETEPYPVSREVQQKEKAYGPANDRLEDYMRRGKHDWLATYLEGYRFPRDFDDLGRSEAEQSYVAVVHADGDGMGQRLRAVGKGEPNRDYIQKVRRFSEAVNRAAQQALQATIKALVDELARPEGKKDKIVHRSAFGDVLAEVILQEVEVKEEQGVYYLPFRPLVFGGDDMTFVCDGRLGLSLALHYMRHFETYTADLTDGKGAATASAGVAIVKSHYPFARAYALAEELAKSAKKYKRQVNAEAAGLDWHFARSGLSGRIETIREREYTPPTGRLTLRPVIVGDNPTHRQRTWGVIESGVTVFQDVYPDGSKKPKEPDWSVRRNKVKALRGVLRDGGTAVAQFRAKFNKNETLPVVAADAGMTNWPETGWQGGQDEQGKPVNYCGYFDAIEMLDWYIPLHTQGGGK